MASFKRLTSTFLKLLVCFIPLLAYGASPAAPSWYTSPERGWLWYKGVSPQQLRQKEKAMPQGMARQAPSTPGSSNPASSGRVSYPYSTRMEQARKAFDELLAKAIWEPTLDNVQQMMLAQNAIINRSTAFEKSWMLASLVSGQAYREADQPSPLHRRIYEEQHERQLDQRLRRCARTFGLFLFFKKGCPWCEQFAPIVKRFADQFGFEVKAISSDGEPLEWFPGALKDNGAISQLNPEGIFPSLFLVNPHTRQAIPLSRGLVSYSDLRENFKVLGQVIPNAFVPGEPDPDASDPDASVLGGSVPDASAPETFLGGESHGG